MARRSVRRRSRRCAAKSKRCSTRRPSRRRSSRTNGSGLLDRLLDDDIQPEDFAGRRIGAYKLLKLVGEGGMGQVFLAEREDGDFAQRVALKRMRADFAGAETRARFLREREILARLVHPHVAQLHDGGVADDGTPYFTLEYVDGEPITR